MNDKLKKRNLNREDKKKTKQYKENMTKKQNRK